jgi:hypothetical protein
MSKAAKLKHDYLMTLTLEVDSASAYPIGMTLSGNRMVAPIVGGTFSGPRLEGVVLPGGADWVVVGSDGSMKIDVRTTLKTTDGAFIYLQYRGRFIASAEAMQQLHAGNVLAPEEYSLAVSADLETGHEEYAWLNDAMVVGTGQQSGFNPTYSFFTVG